MFERKLHEFGTCAHLKRTTLPLFLFSCAARSLQPPLRALQVSSETQLAGLVAQLQAELEKRLDELAAANAAAEASGGGGGWGWVG